MPWKDHIKRALILASLSIGTSASAQHPAQMGVSDRCLGSYKDADVEWVRIAIAAPLIRKYEGKFIYTELWLAGAPYANNVRAKDEYQNSIEPDVSFSYDFLLESWLQMTGGDISKYYNVGVVGAVRDGSIYIRNVCAFNMSDEVAWSAGHE